MENSLRAPPLTRQRDTSDAESSWEADGSDTGMTSDVTLVCSGEVSEIDRELEAALEYKLACGGPNACREVLDLMVEVLSRHRR